MDRLILTEGLVEKWKFSGQIIWKSNISNHCPIWTQPNLLNSGSKPFETINCWFAHLNFVPFIKEVQKSTMIQGRSAFFLN